MSNIFGNDSDSDAEVLIKPNTSYAKSYNSFRQKELLQHLKDKGVTVDDESSDSDSSEDLEINDPDFEKNFFLTLASLKSKDPKIYDKNTTFFKGVEDSEPHDDELAKSKKKKEKAFTVKDLERNVMLKRGGVFEDDESENDDNQRSLSPTYVEEQRHLKESLKKAFKESDEEGEDKWGGIFQKREKSEAEQEKDEEKYVKWLSGQKTKIGKESTALKPLKEFWSDPKLSNEDVFLRDYILNNGYREVDENLIPTYDEIVNDPIDLVEDESLVEKQIEFEHKYNFRFEEPDKEFIKRYPRTIEQSVRKTDDRRKEKRAEVKGRKEREKEQRRHEIEMLKALKKQEIEERIAKLKRVTGDTKLPFDDNYLNEDFDPEEYDKKMQETFNNEYYQIPEGDQKPECPDIEELLIDDWDNYDPNEDSDTNVKPAHCEDPDFVMDCDFDETARQQVKKNIQNELIESTKGKRKTKRRSKFKEVLKKTKPVFDPEDEKTYSEYIDEYYKLDCEDIIGDTPCRFKYVKTVPNDFGLTIEEILMAKNKELNRWASLKKAVQIRPEHIEKNEARAYKLRAQNEELKRKIFKSLYDPSSENDSEEEKTPAQVEKRKRNKHKNRKQLHAQSEAKLSTQVGTSPAKSSVGDGSLPELAASGKKEKIEIVTASVELNGLGDGDADVKTHNNSDVLSEDKQSNKKKHNTTSLTDEECVNNEQDSVAGTVTKKKASKKQKHSTSKEIEKAPTLEMHSEVAKISKKRNKPLSSLDHSETQGEKPESCGNSVEQKKMKNKKKKETSLNGGESMEPIASLDEKIEINKNHKTEELVSKKGAAKAKNQMKGRANKKMKSAISKLLELKSKKQFKANSKWKTAKKPADEISENRLRAFGINPKKYFNKQKYGKKPNH